MRLAVYVVFIKTKAGIDFGIAVVTVTENTNIVSGQ
jgi:hypothetical protein